METKTSSARLGKSSPSPLLRDVRLLVELSCLAPVVARPGWTAPKTCVRRCCETGEEKGMGRRRVSDVQRGDQDQGTVGAMTGGTRGNRDRMDRKGTGIRGTEGGFRMWTSLAVRPAVSVGWSFGKLAQWLIYNYDPLQALPLILSLVTLAGDAPLFWGSAIKPFSTPGRPNSSCSFVLNYLQPLQ